MKAQRVFGKMRSLARLSGLLALALLMNGMGAAWLSGRAQGQGVAPVVFVRYQINRSSVPAWVTYRDLTLRLQAGGAEAVWAWGDGQPLAVRHERAAGRVFVTADAGELLVAFQGASLAPNVGDYTVTTLKDDKRWAFSLTFDDGELSVYTHAFPELRRYGYRAGVAVIGCWLERCWAGQPDPVQNGYCGAAELQQLLDAGWSVFNHSYVHFQSPSDITLADVQRCQDAIRNQLNGYRATVFTVPYTSPLWPSIIDNNAQALGLYLMQLSSETGERLMVVDQPITLTQAAYHIGRDDIKDWNVGGYNYFDQAHSLATAATPQHAWVSLHGHNINYDQDWCAVADAASYLYHAYGAGGSDEVWVAPADEVFQYRVVRSYTRVTRTSGTARALEPTVTPTRLISYRQGVDGFQGWSDSYIHTWYPDGNYGSLPYLRMRWGTGSEASLLLRVEPAPPDERAVVLNATLSLYAFANTRAADVDMAAYRLERAWLPSEATWKKARQGLPWAEAGARAVALDRAAQASDEVHAGACALDERWYTFDVTALVQDWLAHPERNWGVLIEGHNDVAKGTDFASSESPEITKRPVLRVLYGWPLSSPATTPTVTPPSPMTGAIRGLVWEDGNRNQIQEVGELPLSGVLIELRDANHALLHTLASDAEGGFRFIDLPPATYRVLEYDPPGYISTTSNTVTVAVTVGQESLVLFGDRLPTPDGLPPLYLPLLLRGGWAGSFLVHHSQGG